MSPKAIFDLIAEIGAVVFELAEAGLTTAEIRKRVADGIQRGDVVSDAALDKVKELNDRLAEYRGGA